MMVMVALLPASETSFYYLPNQNALRLQSALNPRTTYPDSETIIYDLPLLFHFPPRSGDFEQIGELFGY